MMFSRNFSMAQKDPPVWKYAKAFLLLISILSGLVQPVPAELSLDSERLDLEMRMQSRVEEALGKILPPGQFVVVIRVEPLAKSEVNPNARGNDDSFYLPGVPVRQKFD